MLLPYHGARELSSCEITVSLWGSFRRRLCIGIAQGLDSKVTIVTGRDRLGAGMGTEPRGKHHFVPAWCSVVCDPWTKVEKPESPVWISLSSTQQKAEINLLFHWFILHMPQTINYLPFSLQIVPYNFLLPADLPLECPSVSQIPSIFSQVVSLVQI